MPIISLYRASFVAYPTVILFFGNLVSCDELLLDDAAALTAELDGLLFDL
jgi:hypothetical protein